MPFLCGWEGRQNAVEYDLIGVLRHNIILNLFSTLRDGERAVQTALLPPHHTLILRQRLVRGTRGLLLLQLRPLHLQQCRARVLPILYVYRESGIGTGQGVAERGQLPISTLHFEQSGLYDLDGNVAEPASAHHQLSKCAQTDSLQPQIYSQIPRKNHQRNPSQTSPRKHPTAIHFPQSRLPRLLHDRQLNLVGPVPSRKCPQSRTV